MRIKLIITFGMSFYITGANAGNLGTYTDKYLKIDVGMTPAQIAKIIDYPMQKSCYMSLHTVRFIEYGQHFTFVFDQDGRLYSKNVYYDHNPSERADQFVKKLSALHKCGKNAEQSDHFYRKIADIPVSSVVQSGSQLSLSTDSSTMTLSILPLYPEGSVFTVSCKAPNSLLKIFNKYVFCSKSNLLCPADQFGASARF